MHLNLKISVVIPVYNNDSTLIELSERLALTLNRCAKVFEIIFVNDGSHDNSLSILKALAIKEKSIKIINLSKNFGQHPAICAGFEHADGDIIVLMDADLQDRPEDIPLLVNKLNDECADIVYSIKSPAKKTATRLTSFFYHYTFAKIVGANVPQNIGTFRTFRRNFLNALLRFKEVNILYGPLMFYMGFRSCYLNLPYQARASGKSSYTFNKRLQLAINSLISYTDVPHRLSIVLGFILVLVSLIYGGIVIFQYLIFGSSLPRGSTLILIALCLTLGSVMMTLGVIGSYVFRVYQEVLNRPRYLVQETVNCSIKKD